MKVWRRAFLVVLTLALGYFVVTTTAYRFRHPEKTETQLFLEIPHALRWQR